MTYPKMRPCSKCGGEVDLWTYESGWSRVECPNPKCDHISSCEGTKLAAIKSHNEASGDQAHASTSKTVA
jgi:hypothetical protein